MSERVQLTIDNHVATVRMSRPEKRNAINAQMMQEVLDAFCATPPESERVTVIRALGPVFCAGLQLSTDGVAQSEAERIESMFDAVQRYPLPVVAVVQGAAIAGGCELALHCDFIVAADDAPFAMPLAQLGVATTWFLTKKLMEFAGPTTTREFLLLGEAMNAARLHQLGIVTRAVPAEELDSVASKLSDCLAANAPLAMRVMKEQILRHTQFMMDIEHGDIDPRVAAVYASADALEGVSARVERRSPNFHGS